MKSLDFREVNARSPIRAVIDSYGIPVGRGNIPCLAGTHEDKHPSMKVYEGSNSCYCFTCRRSMRPLDIVMAKDGCDVVTAAHRLAGMFGLEETEVMEYYPLRYDDYRYLDLDGSAKAVPRTYKGCDDDDIFPSARDSVFYGLRDLWREDRECFNAIVGAKAIEQEGYYEYLVALRSMSLSEDKDAFDKLQTNMLPVKKLWEAYEAGQRYPEDSDEFRLLCADATIKLSEQALEDARTGLTRLKAIEEYCRDDRQKEEYER